MTESTQPEIALEFTPSQLFDLLDHSRSGKPLPPNVRQRLEASFDLRIYSEEAEAGEYVAEVARESAARGHTVAQPMLTPEAIKRILNEGFNVIGSDADLIELALSGLALDQLRMMAAEATSVTDDPDDIASIYPLRPSELSWAADTRVDFFMEDSGHVVYQLPEERGTVTLTDVGGQARVVFQVEGEPPGTRIQYTWGSESGWVDLKGSKLALAEAVAQLEQSFDQAGRCEPRALSSFALRHDEALKVSRHDE